MTPRNTSEKTKDKGFFGPIVSEMISELPDRTRDILSRRYNLFGKYAKGKTLDAIGKHYGITRERVRQIIEFSMKTIRNRGAKNVESAIVKIENALIARGGISTKEQLVKDIQANASAEVGALDFVLDFSDRFTILLQNHYFVNAVSLADFDHDQYKNRINALQGMFEETKRPKKIGSIRTFLARIESSEELIPLKHIESFLASSAIIDCNPLGEWGLILWSEIRPRSAGERAYLVLRHAGKALHFLEIAKRIDELGFSPRRSNPQTVHNELIKRSYFVLSGRGTYGLVEWKK